jgi:hypothetical protein
MHWATPFGATFMLSIAPYLLLNQRASGQLIPSTIAAKATYYGGSNLMAALASYMAQVAIVMLASSVVLLLLAALSYSHWILARPRIRQEGQEGIETKHNWDREQYKDDRARTLTWLLLAWPLVLIVAYAGRLPLLYHNGRYLMPILPPLIALGAAGALPLLMQRRPLARVALGLIAVAGVFSLFRGAQIYGENVRFINSCQVDAARWLSTHTAPGTLIATHDIGAIGYFARRPIVDIAGLVDPRVTPYLSDQPRLEAYLKARRVGYVVEFTDWFSPPNTLAHDLAGAQVYHARGSPRFVVLRTDW